MYLRSLALGLALLTTAPASQAAEHIDPWSPFWEILATDVGCSLQRKFSNADAQEAGFYYGADGTTFDRFMIWFYVPSVSRELPGASYEANELHFSIYSELYPKVSEIQRRIESVRLNDIDLHRENLSEMTSVRQFIARKGAAREILKLFETGNSIVLSFRLSGGEDVRIDVPNEASERFGLWSRLLATCASEMAANHLD